MALVASVTKEKYLVFGVSLGILSVLYWNMYDDLRPYMVVQFGAILVLCLTQGKQYLPVIGLYVLAKVFEAGDHQIATVLAMGGHPLKHLAAAGALYAFIQIEKRLDKDAIS